MRYRRMETTSAAGPLVDFDNDYKTMDLHLESVIWAFNQLYEGPDLRAKKVMPYSWNKTP